MFLKVYSKEFVSHTWGMIHFPSWAILEALIQMLKLQIRFWDYFRYSPAVTKKRDQQYPQQMIKRSSDFPKQEWYRCLRDGFLCILSKFKSYRISPELSIIFKGRTSLFPNRSSEGKILYSDIRYHNPLQSLQIQKSPCILSKFKSYRISPILLSPKRDITYLQRSLSPAEFSSRMILVAISANSRVTGFPLQYHLISEDDTAYPQRRPQKIHKFKEPQGISCIFEESISILLQNFSAEMKFS